MTADSAGQAGAQAPVAPGISEPPPTSDLRPVADQMTPAASGRRRLKRWHIMLGVASLLTVCVMAAVSVVLVIGNGGPSLDDARRDCRTAFGKEFDERNARAGSSSSQIIVSVTGIELQEARDTENGFEVNGVVRYDLTSMLGTTVHSTLNLTCEARKQDGRLVITVRNRT